MSRGIENPQPPRDSQSEIATPKAADATVSQALGDDSPAERRGTAFHGEQNTPTLEQLERVARDFNATRDTKGRSEGSDLGGGSREAHGPQEWSHAKRTFVQTEAAQLQRRVDRAIEVAAHMPNLDGLSLDSTEFENLAQNVRITGALLKEEIDRLVSEPDEQGTWSVNSLLESLLAEVERLEERARPLREAVDTQPGGGPSATATRTADRVVSWVDDLKNWLRGALTSFWALISQLLTPKEWTIAGKIGAGVAPFGLTEVSASVKFGR